MVAIDVIDEEWGCSLREDVQVLLFNVADHFNRYLSEPVPNGRILVRRRMEGVPQILYRDGGVGPYTILLSASDRKWAQFSYQFAHEYFHFLSNYESLRGARHRWFEEVLGEVASIFALRRMAETWVSDPPYHNWRAYSKCLLDYASESYVRENRRMPEGVSVSEWFKKHEEKLLKDPYLRDVNASFAIKLVPVFEQEPTYWELVRHVPSTIGSFSEFLEEWRRSSPIKLRAGIDTIAKIFEIC